MSSKMPRTPFSTALSGSARETEIRIRNIFSGPKKRPPIPVMALTALMILLCGNLVSFRLPPEPALPISSQVSGGWKETIRTLALSLAAAEKPGADSLPDPEVCLYQEGTGQLIGPPLSLRSSFLAPLLQEVYVHPEDSGPEGYTKLSFSGADRNLIAGCWQNDATGQDFLTLLDVNSGLPGLYTPRGIRVGDSREAVLAAYPDIRTTRYLGYGGDYLWYCADGEGRGPALIFFFFHDRVIGIQLHDESGLPDMEV